MNAFESACAYCKKQWEEIEGISISSFPKISQKQQIQNETYLQELLKEIEGFYEGQDFEMLDAHMKQWFQRDEVWNLSWLSEEEREIFYQISKSFMRDARSFDDNLCIEDIGQALRNVWIILILEKVCNRPLSYHKAIFAYSMLYPYTDNFLDDKDIETKDKKEFNNWLSNRLMGIDTTYQKENQKKVNELVSMIESTYPRDSYEDVYHSLLHIQDGQKKSLLQSDIEDYQTLLEISIEKGGASVLADGYLMDGTLSDEEYKFCISFGFMLQIADDIQDIHEDYENGFHTLASIQRQKRDSVSLCNAYFQYVHSVIHDICPNKDGKLRNFIEENCRLLIFFSLLKNTQYYTRSFLYQVQKRIPLRTSFLQSMNSNQEKWGFSHEEFIQKFDMYLQSNEIKIQ